VPCACTRAADFQADFDPLPAAPPVLVSPTAGSDSEDAASAPRRQWRRVEGVTSPGSAGSNSADTQGVRGEEGRPQLQYHPRLGGSGGATRDSGARLDPSAPRATPAGATNSGNAAPLWPVGAAVKASGSPKGECLFAAGCLCPSLAAHSTTAPLPPPSPLAFGGSYRTSDHWHQHSPPLLRPPPAAPSRPTTALAFQCQYCEYTTSCRTTMRQHEQRHTGDKPYRCAYCPYAAVRKGQVSHRASAPSDTPPLFGGCCAPPPPLHTHTRMPPHPHPHHRRSYVMLVAPLCVLYARSLCTSAPTPTSGPTPAPTAPRSSVSWAPCACTKRSTRATSPSSASRSAQPGWGLCLLPSVF
jgi:hypothetical protein